MLENILELAAFRGKTEEPAEALIARGKTTFMGMALRVVSGALVPRPETELLALTAIDTLRLMPQPTRVVDMCCGVGNLALAIAHYVPTAQVWASDLTRPCVEAARDNVSAHSLERQVEVMQGDLFAALSDRGLEGTIDAIVCNPPYISSRRLLQVCANLLLHEPREAFDAGPYGLAIHQRVVRDAIGFLKPGGWLMLEFGVGQAAQVRMLFERAGGYDEIRFARNGEGIPRVAMGRVR